MPVREGQESQRYCPSTWAASLLSSQLCTAPVAADHEAPYDHDDYEQHYDHHAAEQEESATAAAVDALNAAAQHAADFQQQQHQQQLEQDAGSLLAPLLLVTTVDIGDGKADRIEVRQGDVPLEVANAFVSKHGLPTAVVPRLAMHLEENLLKVEVQRRAAVGDVLLWALSLRRLLHTQQLAGHGHALRKGLALPAVLFDTQRAFASVAVHYDQCALCAVSPHLAQGCGSQAGDDEEG